MMFEERRKSWHFAFEYGDSIWIFAKKKNMVKQTKWRQICSANQSKKHPYERKERKENNHCPQIDRLNRNSFEDWSCHIKTTDDDDEHNST